MKIDLVQERRSPYAAYVQPIKRMAPFLQKSTGRVHRIRSATLHFHHGAEHCWGGRSEHVAVALWCGGSGFLSRNRGHLDLLLHEPPDGAPICATCEGRAVGAGQQPSAWLLPPDRPLIFTPRRA